MAFIWEKFNGGAQATILYNEYESEAFKVATTSARG